MLGRDIVTVVPTPGTLATIILPPCFSTSPLLNGRPRPVPERSPVCALLTYEVVGRGAKLLQRLG